MKKLRIENYELRMKEVASPHPQLTNHNPQFFLALLILSAGSFLSAATPAPTPTPTTRPRLTGGFGRAATTPIAAESGGQSLADVVRAASQSKSRKEQKPSVAITNESLVTDPTKGKLTTVPAKAAPAKGVPAPTATARIEPTASAPEASETGAEADWKERARASRQRVEELKARVYQLEGETAALEKDFYRWDDGQYRDGVIKPAWEKKKEELESARKELVQAEKDLADLPEKARKAGALPGWIRE